MERWLVVVQGLMLLSAAAMVTGGIFFVVFAGLLSTLPFHQRRPDDLSGFASPLSLLSDPARLTESGVAIQQRVRRVGKYAALLFGGGAALFVTIAGLVTVAMR